MVPNFKCNSGQGEFGKSTQSLGPISRNACGQKCLELNGCIGIDYTTNIDNKSGGKNNQCRMYNHNTPRSDPGKDDRIYCEVKTEGEKTLCVITIGVFKSYIP